MSITPEGLFWRCLGILSNFLRSPPPGGGDGDKNHDAPLTCHPARREQTHEAIRLILSTPGQPATDDQVIDFLRMAVHRRVDLRDLWVATKGSRIVWAALAIVSAGHSMLLLLPNEDARNEEVTVAIAGVINQVVAHFAGRGVHLAQALVEPGFRIAGVLTSACGFQTVAELVYLQATVRRASPPPRLADGDTSAPYSSETHADFAAAISASYVDSLDCPALNGVRDIEDIIAGHKATGEFDPSLWHVLYRHGRPIAVLLLSPIVRADQLELVYLGIAPEGRGQGIGAMLMKIALASAKERHLSRLTLAVDSRNTPAMRLYNRFGLARVGSKLALIRTNTAQVQMSV